MKTVNTEHIQKVIEVHNSGPFLKLLSIKILELDVGRSLLEVCIDEKHYNPFGSIHGGAYSSALDTACYWAAYCELDENTGYTTSSLKVDSLAMIQKGRMLIEGRTIKIGRSTCLTEARAEDENGKLLAYATSNLLVLDGRQSIKHAFEVMGYQDLPPKFIEIS